MNLDSVPRSKINARLLNRKISASVLIIIVQGEDDLDCECHKGACQQRKGNYEQSCRDPNMLQSHIGAGKCKDDQKSRDGAAAYGQKDCRIDQLGSPLEPGHVCSQERLIVAGFGNAVQLAQPFKNAGQSCEEHRREAGYGAEQE